MNFIKIFYLFSIDYIHDPSYEFDKLTQIYFGNFFLILLFNNILINNLIFIIYFDLFFYNHITKINSTYHHLNIFKKYCLIYNNTFNAHDCYCFFFLENMKVILGFFFLILKKGFI